MKWGESIISLIWCFLRTELMKISSLGIVFCIRCYGFLIFSPPTNQLNRKAPYIYRLFFTWQKHTTSELSQTKSSLGFVFVFCFCKVNVITSYIFITIFFLIQGVNAFGSLNCFQMYQLLCFEKQNYYSLNQIYLFIYLGGLLIVFLVCLITSSGTWKTLLPSLLRRP